MRARWAVLGVVAALTAGALPAAADHIVSQEAAAARLTAAEEARTRDLAALDTVLATPAAREAAARLGSDSDRLRRAAATLSDAELADLAARARAVSLDPAAGLDPDIKLLLTIFLIVAIVVLVLGAV